LLKQLKACPEQIELFSKLYPDGVSYETQDKLQQLVDEISKQGLNVKWFIKKMKLSCVCRRYYENGQLCWEGNYVNGKRNGVWKEYYDNGQLSWEVNYVAGKEDGVWKTYYENGQLCWEGNYVDG
jgi:antitoxin component YwqK of YwqJK toxin-antitoxin module